MSKLLCPKCVKGELVYQIMGNGSCERCTNCGWLSLGLAHLDVVRMSREAEKGR